LNKKPKILIFIDWYLPGYKAGGPIRSCANMVAALNQYYDFYIVTRDTDYLEIKPYDNVLSNEWNQLEDGSKVYYISKDKLSAQTLKKLIKGTDFDMTYINGIFSFFFSIYPLYILNTYDKKIIVSSRGMFAASAIAIKSYKKQLFLFISKSFRLYRKCIFHVTNENEANDVKNVLGNQVKTVVAPNLSIKNDLVLFEKTKQVGELCLVSIARIAPEKNLLFALQVLQKVNNHQIKFDIYGPIYDEIYWNECLEVIKNLPINIQVTYLGSIEPEKVKSVFDKAHFLFLPSRGENFGHIIQESIMANCPVIISNQTPWRNLSQQQLGWDLPLEIEEFARVMNESALMNNEEYQLMVKANFQKASEILNESTNIVEKYKQLFR
jgi:glycosyltransferase involved in cell wall biosynthesis